MIWNKRGCCFDSIVTIEKSYDLSMRIWNNGNQEVSPGHEFNETDNNDIHFEIATTGHIEGDRLYWRLIDGNENQSFTSADVLNGRTSGISAIAPTPSRGGYPYNLRLHNRGRRKAVFQVFSDNSYTNLIAETYFYVNDTSKDSINSAPILSGTYFTFRWHRRYRLYPQSF